ncbi:16S rRNA (cytosine967-C5)-methyltransferase [Desulfuromusa kysingii]|uniref:16S rRNA (cytosine(967)-C(5))-methyltransferase n=1 Tax=Desulfuromusa kysingii TaxID=37625 RepID=A0A1H3VL33_9BACT|nr:16S rRNA (cytosine(967)-C(5))-methyltransferase RsmB [Desulfuromusa kysingii]SDZ74848.1 16S rRNA (cytosine967-C5)-methyltransferase [Desulfuromusa kysingii]
MTSRPTDSPRRAVYEILQRVADGAFADVMLDTILSRSKLEARDRRLVTELVYGILRLQGRIDFALAQFCNQPLQRLQPEVLWLLRLGTYQLLELDRVPAHAAVNSTVELARELHLEQAVGFINGVLRSLDRGKASIPWPAPEKIKLYLQHVCSQPAWLSKEIMRQLPNVEARALGESLAGPPPLTLRVNSLKTSPEDFLHALGEAGHQAHLSTFAPEGVTIDRRGEKPLPGDAQGWYQVQDEASILIAHLLDAHPEQRILDACAAPGGKTTHLAAVTENQSEIVALDKYPRRVEMIQQGALRLGCSSITAKQWDLTEPADFLETQSFDRILLDAPCSGLGVLRRNPEGRWNKSSVNLRELAALQRQILENIAPLVKPEGKLLYSVCTFSHGETDAIIDGFLADHPEFVLENLQQQVSPDWADLFTARGTLRSYPHRHSNMDAFFAARLHRRS